MRGGRWEEAGKAGDFPSVSAYRFQSRDVYTVQYVLPNNCLLIYTDYLSAHRLRLKGRWKRKMRGVWKKIIVQTRSGIVAIEGYLQFERVVSM